MADQNLTVIIAVADANNVLYVPRMKIGVRSLERAFELANSGKVSSITEIRAILIAEGYDTRDLEGRILKGQLRDAVAAVHAAAGRAPGIRRRKQTFRKRNVTAANPDEAALPEMPDDAAKDYDGSAM